jgi:hypothetical protein
MPHESVPEFNLFQGIFPMIDARAQVPETPAKVRPAPKNAVIAMKAG